MKQITVFKCEEYDDTDSPTKLSDFRDWLDKAVEPVPEEFLKDTFILIGSGIRYGDPYYDITVFYERPFTKEELEELQNIKEYATQAGIKKERQLLEELLKKREAGEI